jgi:hypothetical protein
MSCVVCKDLFVIPPYHAGARDGSAHICVLLFSSLAHHFSTVSLGYLWPIHLFIFPLAYAFSFILCCICNAFLLFRFEISLFLSFNRNTYIHTLAVDVISFPNWRRNDTHSRSIFESDGISTSLRFSYRLIDWELYCCYCWASKFTSLPKLSAMPLTLLFCSTNRLPRSQTLYTLIFWTLRCVCVCTQLCI